uniref:ENTH domain-containing protein n=1 Tax=Denticeps clupeoides TaxID=299321 RepID=A0AAY4CXY3_9TELE
LHGTSMSGPLARERAGVAGAAVSRAVVRATAQDPARPAGSIWTVDLVHCTHEINVSIPHLADALLERTASQSWMVVFKALIATHHLMMYGSERFIKHLSSRSSLFNINTFLEKGQFQGYDASIFMRCYSRYLNEKALSYRLVSWTSPKSDGVMRTMSVEKLLKTLPIVQSQLDALLDFEVTPSDLTSGVVHDAFMLLFRDSVRLFAAYNEGVINLLEKYFDMKKSQCTEALEIYTQFLSRMTRLSEFLKVSEVEFSRVPSPLQPPDTLSEALQHHLVSLEKRRAKESSSCSRIFTLAAVRFSAGSFLKPPPLTGQVPNTGIHVSLHTGAKLLGGDLDSSLASLVGSRCSSFLRCFFCGVAAESFYFIFSQTCTLEEHQLKSETFTLLHRTTDCKVPPQMGQMSSVPVMAPPPVIYNQPILRTTHPFGPVPGAQVSLGFMSRPSGTFQNPPPSTACCVV